MRALPALGLALLVVSSLCAGCTSSRSRGGGGGGGGGLSAWEEYCYTTGPERADRCGDGAWDASDSDSCQAQASCLQTVVRADLFGDIADCLGERGCGESDDRCFAAEGLGASPSSASTAYRDDCLVRRDECTEEGTPFGDDYCYADILSDAAIAEARACLDGPCGELSSCFASIVGDC